VRADASRYDDDRYVTGCSCTPCPWNGGNWCARRELYIRKRRNRLNAAGGVWRLGDEDERPGRLDSRAIGATCRGLEGSTIRAAADSCPEPGRLGYGNSCSGRISHPSSQRPKNRPFSWNLGRPTGMRRSPHLRSEGQFQHASACPTAAGKPLRPLHRRDKIMVR
jgi:hypothetical protein